MKETYYPNDPILREIEALREQVHELQRQGEALTSETIMEKSRRMDQLIVTYLRNGRSGRKPAKAPVPLTRKRS